MSTIAPRTASRVLLPFRHLDWRSLAAGCLACLLPGLLVALTIGVLGDGHAVPALVLVGLVIALGGVLSVVTRARLEITPAGLDAFWTQGRPVVHVPAEQVKQAVVRTIQNGDGVTADRHLFLVDGSGRTLFRMCDRWWREADLAVVARHFEVPLLAQPEVVQLAELRRSVPEQLRWRERHTATAGALRLAIGFALCLVVAALCVASL